MRFSTLALVAAMAAVAIGGSLLQGEPTPAAGPYKVLKSEKVGGDGGFDYVYADAASRRLFIVRSGRPGGRADAYDLDTVKLVGSIPDVDGGHGVAVDAKSGHGFTSSNPIVMFDPKTLAAIKTIKVEGNPDGIMAEPSTGHIFVLSHRAPNVTVLNGEDGMIVGTIDLGGAPEQGASDGKGHVYIDLEDKDRVAVVDAQTNKMTGSYELGDKGKAPAGMSMDAKNGILFCCCRRPAVCVIMNAADGKILDTLPIGAGVDAAEFNPDTLEAFSSQGDGTLTIIKENSPSSFAVEQTVATPKGAKCSTLDLKTGQIYLTSAERAAAPAGADGGGRRGGGRGGAIVPGSFTITVVGK